MHKGVQFLILLKYIFMLSLNVIFYKTPFDCSALLPERKFVGILGMYLNASFVHPNHFRFHRWCIYLLTRYCAWAHLNTFSKCSFSKLLSKYNLAKVFRVSPDHRRLYCSSSGNELLRSYLGNK